MKKHSDGMRPDEFQSLHGSPNPNAPRSVGVRPTPPTEKPNVSPPPPPPGGPSCGCTGRFMTGGVFHQCDPRTYGMPTHDQRIDAGLGEVVRKLDEIIERLSAIESLI